MSNKIFPVIYQDECFMVNPSQLFDASQTFRDLINERGPNIQNIQLKILYTGFTKRNIENFLKICQNQQTDTRNSELTEICLIAQMFQANKILNTALTFIQNNFDSNYTIPSNQFEGSNGGKYLIIEDIVTETPAPTENQSNANELLYDDDDDCEQNQPEAKEEEEQKDNNNQIPKKKKLPSVYYEITSDNPIMKCPRYYFKKDGKVIYMAKQKNDEIYIGPGDDFHISENKSENTAKISRDGKGYNVVSTNDQEFKIKFLKFGENYSMDLTFIQNGSKFNWSPKNPKSTTSFKGEFKRKPIKSKRNIILQNQRNHPTYILRKMSKKSFECECHQSVNPIIAFSISLSQIIGPISI